MPASRCDLPPDQLATIAARLPKNHAESETRVNFLAGHQAPPDLQGAKVLASGARAS